MTARMTTKQAARVPYGPHGCAQGRKGSQALPDRRTGETWFARGPSGRAASPGVKVPTRASVRVTSGAYRSDLNLCRSTRTVGDEDKAL